MIRRISINASCFPAHANGPISINQCSINEIFVMQSEKRSLTKAKRCISRWVLDEVRPVNPALWNELIGLGK